MRILLVVLPAVVVLMGCSEKNASAPQQPRPAQGAQLSGRGPDLKTRLTGRWFPEGAAEGDEEIAGCFCDRCLNIQFDQTDDSFCVESNQIFVSAYFELDEANKKVALYFKEPTDLGRGGASLPWDEYDRKKPIATIDASRINDNILEVKWIGFTKKSGNPEEMLYGGSYAGVYRKLGNK